MNFIKKILIISLLLCFVLPCFAQEEEKKEVSKTGESTEVNKTTVKFPMYFQVAMGMENRDSDYLLWWPCTFDIQLTYGFKPITTNQDIVVETSLNFGCISEYNECENTRTVFKINVLKESKKEGKKTVPYYGGGLSFGSDKYKDTYEEYDFDKDEYITKQKLKLRECFKLIYWQV